MHDTEINKLAITSVLKALLQISMADNSNRDYSNNIFKQIMLKFSFMVYNNDNICLQWQFLNHELFNKFAINFFVSGAIYTCAYISAHQKSCPCLMLQYSYHAISLVDEAY